MRPAKTVARTMRARTDAASDVAVVWNLHADRTLEPVKIRSGITDHTVTEVAQILKGELKEGEELVLVR